MRSTLLLFFFTFTTLSYSQIEDTSNIYTDKGELARVEVWNRTNENIHKLIYQKVFWEQMLDSTYVFVSKEGFVKVKDGISVPLDSKTPDNIIEKVIDQNNQKHVLIWRQGKRIQLSGSKLDGTKYTEVNGDEGAEYIWENGEKKFLRKLTKSEVEDIEKEAQKAAKEAAEYLKSIGE